MFYSAIGDFPSLALASLGFYISLRFLKFPDLSVDASIMFGGSALVFTLQMGAITEIFALLLTMLFGFLIGCLTGILHSAESIRMNKFLAGMLVAFGAYSICFRLAGNSANISLFEYRHLLLMPQLFRASSAIFQPVSLSFLVLLIWYLLQKILNSPFGYSMRAAGHRPDVLRVCGLNSKLILILGLGFSNMLVATSGWLDAAVNLNVSLQPFGSIINILAACLIGDFLRYSVCSIAFSTKPHLVRHVGMLLISPILGALAFSFIKAFVLRILSGQLNIALTTDLYLIVSICILLVSWVGRRLNNFGETEEDMEL